LTQVELAKTLEEREGMMEMSDASKEENWAKDPQ